ncbi:MAG: P-type conjugative transfer protein TrbJ [Acidobacteriota bacterium]|nr:P-type conjugative transfer protein TrbJ [Acidobacteriota bacterium]
MRKIIVLISAILLVEELGETPQTAQAGAFATEITQYLNYGQLLNANLTAASQLTKQIQMLQNSIRNLVTIPNQIFGQIQSDINALNSVVQGGYALAYSMANLNSQFASRFKGFTGFRPANYYSNYQTWSQTSLDTTLGTLRAAGLQGQQLQSEQSVLTSLRSMAQRSGGEMEALQVLGQISEQEVQQLMKLRELMLADLQSKQAYQAAMIQHQANGEAAAQQFFQFGGAVGDGLTFLPGWH